MKDSFRILLHVYLHAVKVLSQRNLVFSCTFCRINAEGLQFTSWSMSLIVSKAFFIQYIFSMTPKCNQQVYSDPIIWRLIKTNYLQWQFYEDVPLVCKLQRSCFDFSTFLCKVSGRFSRKWRTNADFDQVMTKYFASIQRFLDWMHTGLQFVNDIIHSKRLYKSTWAYLS